MKKVLVIVGSTATGKSDLAIELLKEFNGEIISGDSIQIYQGLDIGSAKISKDYLLKYPHHLIDILSPFDSYSVYDFQKNARDKIKEISLKNKLPIIAGGTGLYIKATIYDYEFSTKENHSFESDLDNESLWLRLKELDPLSADKIHPNNRVRVLRAINIALEGVKKSELESKQKKEKIYDVLMIGIKKDREILYQNIEKRIDKMFEQGLLQEVENLLKQGLDFSYQSLKGIGYKEFKEYFENTISLNEVRNLIIRNSKRFAKRQETWFKNQEQVEWYEFDDILNIKKRVKEWLNE